jgi:hypothetical protein
MIVDGLEGQPGRPEEGLRLRCCRYSGDEIPRKEVRLQLADPIPAGGEYQVRIPLHMVPKRILVEPRIGERRQRGRQPAERAYEHQLPCDHADDETEPRLPRELEPGLGLSLHIAKAVSAREQVREQMGGGIPREGEAARFLRQVEAVPQQFEACVYGPCPEHDVAS